MGDKLFAWVGWQLGELLLCVRLSDLQSALWGPGTDRVRNTAHVGEVEG